MASNGKSASELKVDAPVASIVDVAAIAAATPKTGHIQGRFIDECTAQGRARFRNEGTCMERLRFH